MPLPLPVILAAAASVAKDERTHKAARAIFDAGSSAMERRRLAKAESSAEEPVVSKPEAAWKSSLSKRLRLRKGQAGDLLRFEYTDEDGIKTERMIGNWTSDGKTLCGYCLNRKAERTFDIKGVGSIEEIEVSNG